MGSFVKGVGESRPGWGAGAAFGLTGLELALAVVAHDGGVRLICAGWVPHDDGSDVNGSAVYSRASHTIIVRIVLWLIGSWQVGSLTAPTPGSPGPAKYGGGWLLQGCQ